MDAILKASARRNAKRKLLVVSLIAALASHGCGSVNYSPPSSISRGENLVIVGTPRELFWKSFVAALSADFFVINNLDKETGLINVSYSGDPEQYVDCGRIKVDAYSRIYDFPGSRGNQQYERTVGIKLYYVNRSMSLEGRMNILAQEADAKSTSVTVNTRYVLNRRMTVTDREGRSASNADSVSFNYGHDGVFNGTPLTCRSTGMLERQIISIAQRVGGAASSSPTTVPQKPMPASGAALQANRDPGAGSRPIVSQKLSAQLYLIKGPIVTNPPQTFSGDFDNGNARIELSRRILTGDFELFAIGVSIQSKYKPSLIKSDAIKPLAGADAKGFAALSDGTGLELECAFSITRATGRGEGTCADNQQNTYRLVFD